ncbi:hypothetical protein SLE2022_299320 [Rubroshorea leprosula]
MSGTGAHILVYPFQSSGHIIPLLDLTHRFLTRGLTVTVIVTPNNLSLLDPLFSRHPSSSLQSLVLPWPTITNSALGHHRLFGMLSGFRDLHYSAILQWFRSHPSPPVAIISDFFLGWTQNLASELGIKRVLFSPSGAFGYSVGQAIWKELPKKETDGDIDNENYIVTFQTLPNSPKFAWYQISHLYRNTKEGDPDREFFRSNSLSNMTSWGRIYNTFSELERVYIDHAKKEIGQDRVWAVGPLLPPEDDAADLANRGGSSTVQCSELMTWLDGCKDHSVVYVCFGSRYVLTREQMDALAAALEKSGVHFVWCVRYPGGGPTSSDDGVIPDGFEDRVAGRGFLVKGWAPQVAILRHRAVGAFLTHCGWNSTLEGISAGVVMLTWPMGADQFSDARLLVDQLGVGIQVGESTQIIPDSTQLARVLTESVEEDIPERSRAKKLSEAAASAVMKGGSSERDLDAFVEAVNQLRTD